MYSGTKLNPDPSVDQTTMIGSCEKCNFGETDNQIPCSLSDVKGKHVGFSSSRRGGRFSKSHRPRVAGPS